jgi:ribosomal protein L21E
MKNRSVADANQDQKEKYKTTKNKYEDFPVGSRVRVICVAQDMYFFHPEYEDLTGTVIRNSGQYLGIIVRWDIPRQYENHLQEEFNFEPQDLVLIETKHFSDQLSML